MDVGKGLIGVIVPVYKVEKYIAECIESILAQTYTKFRLILVDDGTPDNAGKTCEEYAKKDSRITVIHQENAGVTRARARGVKEAYDCEFITFVDADDTITPTMLELCMGNIDGNTDIVIGAMRASNEKNSHNDIYEDCEWISLEDFKTRVIFLRGGIGGKFYRRILFNDFTFDIPREIAYGEDAVMNLRLAFNTDKDVKFINSHIYIYNQHEESCCSTFNFSEEYEEKLIELLFNSIPQNKQEEYKRLFIKRKLWAWERRYNNSHHRPKWGSSNFHIQLKSDVKREKLNIDFFSKALLIYTNPVLRFILIALRKVFSLFKKSNQTNHVNMS